VTKKFGYPREAGKNFFSGIHGLKPPQKTFFTPQVFFFFFFFRQKKFAKILGRGRGGLGLQGPLNPQSWECFRSLPLFKIPPWGGILFFWGGAWAGVGTKQNPSTKTHQVCGLGVGAGAGPPFFSFSWRRGPQFLPEIGSFFSSPPRPFYFLLYFPPLGWGICFRAFFLFGGWFGKNFFLCIFPFSCNFPGAGSPPMMEQVGGGVKFPPPFLLFSLWRKQISLPGPCFSFFFDKTCGFPPPVCYPDGSSQPHIPPFFFPLGLLVGIEISLFLEKWGPGAGGGKFSTCWVCSFTPPPFGRIFIFFSPRFPQPPPPGHRGGGGVSSASGGFSVALNFPCTNTNGLRFFPPNFLYPLPLPRGGFGLFSIFRPCPPPKKPNHWVGFWAPGGAPGSLFDLSWG